MQPKGIQGVDFRGLIDFTAEKKHKQTDEMNLFILKQNKTIIIYTYI